MGEWDKGLRECSGGQVGTTWVMLAFHWQSLEPGPDPGVTTLLCLRPVAGHSQMGLEKVTAPLNLPPQSLLSRECP